MSPRTGYLHPGGRPRPGPAPSLSPHQLRQAWVESIRLGALVAAEADRAGDEQHQPAALGHGMHGANVTRLAAALRHLGPENFPVESWSARVMATAFLALAKGAVNPAMSPQARTACAPFLAAGAQALEGLMGALRTDESASWRGRMGEVD
jgi:hypothetical protein